MTGTTTAFMEIQILVYFTFLITNVFYVARSRFMKSGIDNSEQFEDVYMSYLVNKIIQAMVFKGKKYNKKFNASNFIDKQRSIEIQAIDIKVKLSAADFNHIKQKIDEKEMLNFVDEHDSITWIQRCIVGGITKAQLDK